MKITLEFETHLHERESVLLSLGNWLAARAHKGDITLQNVTLNDDKGPLILGQLVEFGNIVHADQGQGQHPWVASEAIVKAVFRATADAASSDISAHRKGSNSD